MCPVQHANADEHGSGPWQSSPPSEPQHCSHDLISELRELTAAIRLLAESNEALVGAILMDDESTSSAFPEPMSRKR